MAATEDTMTVTPQASAHTGTLPLLVCLGAAHADASSEQTAALLQVLHLAMELAQASIGAVTVALPELQAPLPVAEQDGFTLLSYTAAATPDALTIHTAATWLSVAGLMHAQGASAALLLGQDAQSLAPEALAGMIDAVLGHKADLALPHYVLPANQGLVNQAILAPLSRALFTAQIGFPLPLDAAFSARMADRMAAAAHRVPIAAQGTTILWPVDEAATAGFDLAEVGNTTRSLPPIAGDLSQILREVAGSLFADIEAKATFWQRSRPAKETLRLEASEAAAATPVDPADDQEIEDLLTSFRIGYDNLHDIWSLVLPPQTLVSLKRLSQAGRDSFALAAAVWVRIVYDFVLAHRLRTLPRGQLLGALTPLYLAWVASHLLALRTGRATNADMLSSAFEADRPYLVSRWRWPDRFNP